MPPILAVCLVSLLAQAPSAQDSSALASRPDRPPVLVPGPYDFRDATALLEATLPELSGQVAVLVRQAGREVFRFQSGPIGFDTTTPVASLSKTVSGAVMLGSIEDGLLDMGETVGEALPILFPSPGIGDATVLDCWAMRHGIDAPLPYEHLRFFDHAQSVVQIGRTGFQQFPAGEKLGYDGKGMQVTGYVAATRAGLSWEDLASQRILAPLGMRGTDYLQFSPNPSVPGGMRSTALDMMRFADMVLDQGEFRGTQVLAPASIEQLFTNHTRGLPVDASPFPATHPGYPYGVQPDYGFGTWVLAENPATQHVEEVIGAGAWGSFLWIDRRRALTAVLVTDVPVGSPAPLSAALGLFGIARAAVEARQVSGLSATVNGADVTLSWTVCPGARGVRVFGSQDPIRDVFDLRAAEPLGQGQGDQMVVPDYPHYAATATVGTLQNLALIPGVNSIER